jgi:uncharacterized protein (TIGR03086 family)
MLTNVTDIRVLDRRAVTASVAIAKRAARADLDRPTPCAGWTLRDLLEHMTVQHRGFRAACLGQRAGLEAWRPRPLGDDPVAAYECAADAVIAAFAADDVLERTFLLPEISTTIEFPATRAIGFHFIDYVVHGWDVARTLGEDYLLDDELAPAALAIAEAVPNGAERTRPSSAFRPARQTIAPSTAALDRILLHLGRAPDWVR